MAEPLFVSSQRRNTCIHVHRLAVHSYCISECQRCSAEASMIAPEGSDDTLLNWFQWPPMVRVGRSLSIFRPCCITGCISGNSGDNIYTINRDWTRWKMWAKIRKKDVMLIWAKIFNRHLCTETSYAAVILASQDNIIRSDNYLRGTGTRQ